MEGAAMSLTPSQAEKVVRADKDAPSPKYNGIKRVYPADARGLAEVLYLDIEDEPYTAYLRGNVVAYTVDGW
jgi:hypothetical protein